MTDLEKVKDDLDFAIEYLNNQKNGVIGINALKGLINAQATVKNLILHGVSNNEERVSVCGVCGSKKELRLIQVCVDEQCINRCKTK